MGLAAARMFAAEGARVSVIDIQEEAGQAFVDEIESAGGQAFFQAANLANPDQTNQALESVITQMGSIDTLFNHAGTIIVKPFHETTDEDYDRLMDINFRSAFMVTRKVVKHMKDNGGGSIIVTASIGSGKAFVYESLYCITKAAV